MTIYYNRHNPEIIKTLSAPLMLMLIGSFFILVSLLATLLQSGFNKENIISILVGSIFLGFCVVFLLGIYFSGGGTVCDLLLGGGANYTLCCFGLLGFMFIVYGFYKMVQSLYEKIKYGNLNRSEEYEKENN